MAAKNNVITLTLQVRLNDGTTSSGKEKIRTVSFSNVKLSATDQQLYDAGAAVASLLASPLSGLRRVDTGELAEEA